MATDYDSWHEIKDVVSVQVIMTTLRNNIELSKRIIKLAVSRIAKVRSCECASALAHAIVTDPALIPTARKEELMPIIGKYIK
jgi:5'-methylthioadenosine phosphorylase